MVAAAVGEFVGAKFLGVEFLVTELLAANSLAAEFVGAKLPGASPLYLTRLPTNVRASPWCSDSSRTAGRSSGVSSSFSILSVLSTALSIGASDMKFLPYQLSVVIDLLPNASRHMAISQPSMSGHITAGKPSCRMPIYLLVGGRTPSYDAGRITSNGNGQSGSNSAGSCETRHIKMQDTIHHPANYSTQQCPDYVGSLGCKTIF